MIPDIPGNDSPRSDSPHPTPPRLAGDAPNGSADATHQPPAADKPTARDQTPAPGTDAGVQSGEAPSGIRSLLKRLPLRQIVVFSVAGIGLYFVWPQLVDLFTKLPALRGIFWLWFVLMVALEAASLFCAWGLMRLSLGVRNWFLIATAQLTGNAVSHSAPGGAALGGTASYQMFAATGAAPERIVSGLTANSLISNAVLFSLPVLSLPAILFGGVAVDKTLLRALLYGTIVFALILVGGAVALFTDRPLHAVGALVQRVRNRLLRHRAPLSDLPERVLEARDLIKDMLGRRWWAALPYAAGNWLFDYGVLLAALAATGARPRASLVLIAYVVAALLGMVPITPGGLGFVEVGLLATLGLAGVGVADATLATLAYRLVSFWLPIPAGGVAYLLYRHRYGAKDASPTAG